jgi:tetratricopeptide (TPR) repeat protein
MVNETTPIILSAASAAMEKGAVGEGLDMLRRLLSVEPNNSGALDLAARAHLATGQVNQALEYAQRAVNQKPLIPFVLTLAEVMRAKGDLQGAANYFAKVLEKSPSELRALNGLGDIYDVAGYRRRAKEFYKQYLANHPDGLDVAIKYSNLLSIGELTTGLEALERAKPAVTAKAKLRLGYLNHTVVYKEWAERARRSLMPYHATRMDELFFNYAANDRDEYERLADEVLLSKPNDKQATVAKAHALLSRNRRLEAEPFFKKIGEFNPNSIYDNIRFEPCFYRHLEAMDVSQIAQSLPKVTNVLPGEFAQDHVVYLSCNHSYFFDFARTMLLSINERAKGTQVHLHVMDGNDADWAKTKEFCDSLRNLKVAITAERPGLEDRDSMTARCYYHAIRFIRLYLQIKHYRKTLWLMDVDALVHQDLRPMFAAMGSADVAFRVRPGRWEPWNQFNASVLAIAPTIKGQHYLRLIAAYVANIYQNSQLRWGVDQLAMYSVYAELADQLKAPAVHILDNKAVDYEYYDDGFVWCNSGRGKFLQLKQLAKGTQTAADMDRSRYFDALKGYVDMLPK